MNVSVNNVPLHCYSSVLDTLEDKQFFGVIWSCVNLNKMKNWFYELFPVDMHCTWFARFSYLYIVCLVYQVICLTSVIKINTVVFIVLAEHMYELSEEITSNWWRQISSWHLLCKSIQECKDAVNFLSEVMWNSFVDFQGSPTSLFKTSIAYFTLGSMDLYWQS